MDNENADLLRRLRKEQQDRHQSKKPDRDVVESRKKRTKEEKVAEVGQQPDDQPLHRSTASRSKKRPSKHKETGSGMKHLPPDFVIKTKGGTRYKVETRIAEHVYVARSKKTDKLYALKAEMLRQELNNKQLKRDVFVLLDASKHQTRFTKHFPHLHNKGKMPGICNYIIMTLCDYNLNDLRAQLLEGCDFSRPNAARLCMQTFQAVHDLHSVGFIHRDISPSKFVLGLDNPHLVYMIGFSMAHHFEQHYDTKLTNSPRRLPSKMTNRTFLPRAYHRSKDINRKDDLESWVYVCFNLFGRKILPWNEQFADLNMFVNKERLFCDGFEECYKYVPRQFQTIMHNLDKLGENERPDYTFIGMMLVTMKENIKFHFYGPFDWQKEEQSACTW
ncbi:hypothetical protein M3Y94_01054000 [Aphelenchoides besseyi]|nr:hypothetical protein M3Y94_01054000 [Aphelenchoides besseyi]